MQSKEGADDLTKGYDLLELKSSLESSVVRCLDFRVRTRFSTFLRFSNNSTYPSNYSKTLRLGRRSAVFGNTTTKR